MKSSDWLEFALFLGCLAAVTKPLGLHLVNVLTPDGRTLLDPLLKPLERLTYAAMGIDPHSGQGWKAYTSSLLLFSVIGCALSFAILYWQHLLPLNPQHLPGLQADMALNTAVSFVTNTNWQSYQAETTMSYFSQMVALVFPQFTSAATGIAVAAALIRGIARHSTQSVGNFWVDLVRTVYYLLLPLAFVLALFLIGCGVVQNFHPTRKGVPLEPATHSQAIAQGPMASQVAIKLLGTNGGGFTTANAAHPFENPTPLSNFVQMLAMASIASAMTWVLGRMTGNQRHGWAVWFAMLVLFVGAALLCLTAETRGNSLHQQLGIAATDGNLEGKEMRFGISGSTLYTAVATATSTGAVNSLPDSYTPLGGAVPLALMQLGEVAFGGAGAGIYSMLIFVILTVFLAGLMVGRSPELLGKRIEAFEIQMAMAALLVVSFSTLGFSAWAASAGWGRAGVLNAGPHGLTEILYAYSSATANNGSAFAGLDASSAGYQITLALAMLIGRFLVILPVMALAGSLAEKPALAIGPGTFPVNGLTFTLLLLSVILLVGALNFLPALALGPVVEQLLMLKGSLF